MRGAVERARQRRRAPPTRPSRPRPARPLRRHLACSPAGTWPARLRGIRATTGRAAPSARTGPASPGSTRRPARGAATRLNRDVCRCISPNGRPSSSFRMSCTSSLVRSTSALRPGTRDPRGYLVDPAELLEHVVNGPRPGRGHRRARRGGPRPSPAGSAAARCPRPARGLGDRPLDVLRRAVEVFDPPPEPGQGGDLARRAGTAGRAAVSGTSSAVTPGRPGLRGAAAAWTPPCAGRSRRSPC